MHSGCPWCASQCSSKHFWIIGHVACWREFSNRIFPVRNRQPSSMNKTNLHLSLVMGWYHDPISDWITCHFKGIQRRPAHAKPDFNWLSGPRNGTWKRTCGFSCLRSLAPMRRLQCSTTHATFTNPSLLRATPLLRGMFQFNYPI